MPLIMDRTGATITANHLAMSALRNLIGTEAKKLFQNPARWREALRPRRWRQFLHVAVFYLRTGNRWQTDSSDGSFERRVYANYQDYLRRQQAKLDFLDLSRYETEYQRLLNERLAGVDGLKKGAAVLCLGARLGAEVRAFQDCGCFAVGLDLNPGKQNRYVLHGDFHEIQFPRESADIIFSNSLDHVFALERFIAEIRRVLKSGGLLILETMKGRAEGVSPDPYASLWWNSVDDVVALFSRHSFKAVQRTAFAVPWPGELLCFVKLESSGSDALNEG
jgi:SAM-dependent methyltransferase